jgi:hypothetical protein
MPTCLRRFANASEGASYVKHTTLRQEVLCVQRLTYGTPGNNVNVSVRNTNNHKDQKAYRQMTYTVLVILNLDTKWK